LGLPSSALMADRSRVDLIGYRFMAADLMHLIGDVR
jgi:hypothetical protein